MDHERFCSICLSNHSMHGRCCHRMFVRVASIASLRPIGRNEIERFGNASSRVSRSADTCSRDGGVFVRSKLESSRA